MFMMVAEEDEVGCDWAVTMRARTDILMLLMRMVLVVNLVCRCLGSKVKYGFLFR